jgi:hypothetical protein
MKFLSIFEHKYVTIKPKYVHRLDRYTNFAVRHH